MACAVLGTKTCGQRVNPPSRASALAEQDRPKQGRRARSLKKRCNDNVTVIDFRCALCPWVVSEWGGRRDRQGLSASFGWACWWLEPGAYSVHVPRRAIAGEAGLRRRVLRLSGISTLGSRLGWGERELMSRLLLLLAIEHVYRGRGQCMRTANGARGPQHRSRIYWAKSLPLYIALPPPRPAAELVTNAR